jgi:hypothetical protein
VSNEIGSRTARANEHSDRVGGHRIGSRREFDHDAGLREEERHGEGERDAGDRDIDRDPVGGKDRHAGQRDQ